MLAFHCKQFEHVIERAASPTLAVQHVTGVPKLMKLLASQRWAAMIADPMEMSDDTLELVATHANQAGMTFLLLAPTTALAARRILRAARRSPVHVIFADSESAGQLLAAQLRTLGAPSPVALLLQQLAPNLDVLPRDLRMGMVSLFGALPVPRSAHALAKRVGCSRRTFDRQMHWAGFRGGARVLSAIRLAWAWELMRESDLVSPASVAVSAGYRTQRQLVTHAKRLLAVRATALGHTPVEASAIGRVGDWVIEEAPGAEAMRRLRDRGEG